MLQAMQFDSSKASTKDDDDDDYQMDSCDKEEEVGGDDHKVASSKAAAPTTSRRLLRRGSTAPGPRWDNSSMMVSATPRTVDVSLINLFSLPSCTTSSIDLLAVPSFS